MSSSHQNAALIDAARVLAKRASRLRFNSPVAHIYNPLDYAWAAHRLYLEEYGKGPKRVLFLGMNPGPFGMVQTGVPFGEVAAVQGWLGITAEIGKPARIHPKRPVDGFRCIRSEVSGRRLWGLFAERFATPKEFFSEHFVVNYCPLAFMDENGRNLTPDKLPAAEAEPLFAACDAHLACVMDILQPEWVVGVGDFAEKRARNLSVRPSLPVSQNARAHQARIVRFGKILHPSPANPSANRDWAGLVTQQLLELGIWDAPRRPTSRRARTRPRAISPSLSSRVSVA
jgi:single-strand selective monofunctional uracil DNA glycosylase